MTKSAMARQGDLSPAASADPEPGSRSRGAMRAARLLLHPLLFALWPIAFLWSHNADQVSLPRQAPVALLCVGAAALLCAAFAVWFRDLERAALGTSLCLALFFTYGILSPVLLKLPLIGRFGGRGAFGVWAAALAALVVLVARSRGPFPRLTGFLTVVGVALVAMPLFRGLPVAARRVVVPPRPPADLAAPAPPVGRPDIYYIILDSYAREDILRRNYFYDNAGFISALRELGFTVADRSRSNYSQTFLSLASSLNGVYHDALLAALGPASTDKRPLREMMARPWAVEVLKKLGYTYVTMLSGWSGTEQIRGDVDLQPAWALTEFRNFVLNTTPLPEVLGWIVPQYQNEDHRRRVLYQLEKLSEVARDPRPTFTFAHIISPHTPFVFGQARKGESDRAPFTLAEPGQLPDGKRRYARQVDELNRRVLASLKSLLAASPDPPVIVLQADHGPKWSALRGAEQAKETLGILNAYYLPPEAATALHPGITPVNTFRLIFNRLFGAGYEALEDRSYYSSYRAPYAFRELTDAGLGPAPKAAAAAN